MESTSKKDKDGHGMMKSGNFLKRFPNPDDELKKTKIVKMVMKWRMWIFPTDFWGLRTHVDATTMCTTGSVRTHLLHAHFFCARAHCVLRTLLKRVTYTHGWSSWKKVFVAWVSLFSISLSPFSCFTHLCCSCTSTTSTCPCRTLPA